MTDESAGLPPYPHTPEEHRSRFVALARGVEEQLFSLSQAVYNEVSEVRDEHPPTHAEIAARIKKVLEEGLATISADHLTLPARAADQAYGYPAAEPGDETALPHT